MASIFELCRRCESGIFAVPYRARRPLKAVTLPDGAIVEAPLPDQRTEAPATISDQFAVAQGGIPATIHHANLGLVVAFLPLAGVFLMSGGDVAAVYGAEVIPLGARSNSPA